MLPVAFNLFSYLLLNSSFRVDFRHSGYFEHKKLVVYFGVRDFVGRLCPRLIGAKDHNEEAGVPHRESLQYADAATSLCLHREITCSLLLHRPRYRFVVDVFIRDIARLSSSDNSSTVQKNASIVVATVS